VSTDSSAIVAQAVRRANPISPETQLDISPLVIPGRPAASSLAEPGIQFLMLALEHETGLTHAITGAHLRPRSAFALATVPTQSSFARKRRGRP
jgi:hypothetical protein